MSTESMLGEISTYSFDFPPKTYKACNGQLLKIAQNQALFSIIGAKFGGDGVTNFALPDLRGRVPLGGGGGIGLGQSGGEEKHTLSVAEMPAHGHSIYGSTAAADQGSPANNLWADKTGQTPYSNQPNTKMSERAIGLSGGNQPHENMSPFLALNFGICTYGNYQYREGTLGEIIMYAGDKVNEDCWRFCNGQLLDINTYTALFSILGTCYGGDGKTTFALPNLQGFAPLQCGQGKGLSNRQLGQSGGSRTVQVLRNQMPNHKHQAIATAAASTTSDPTDAVWATGGQVRGGVPFYASGGSEMSFHEDAAGSSGNEQPHNNMPPYLGVNFLICIKGIFPQRN